jgi:soluble cytochrome b562
MNSLFNYRSWSSGKKLRSLIAAAYVVGLYGFIGGDHVRDQKLAREFEQRNAVVTVEKNPDSTRVYVTEDSEEIFTYQYGEDRFFTRLADRISALNNREKIGRVGAEDNINKLLDYRSRGHKKFIFSFSIPITAASLAYFVHPVGLAAIPAFAYIHLDGESEAFPAQKKLDMLVAEGTSSLEDKIERLQLGLKIKETEPDSRYWPWALYSFILLPLALSGYYGPKFITNIVKSRRKLNHDSPEDPLREFYDEMGKVSPIGGIISASLVLWMTYHGLPGLFHDPRPQQEAAIRHELAADLIRTGENSNLEEAVLHLSRSLELDDSIREQFTDEQRILLGLN